MPADLKPVSSVTVFRENEFLWKAIALLTALLVGSVLFKNILPIIGNFFGGISLNVPSATVAATASGSVFCSGKSLVLSPRNPNIEGEQERGCLSALIDLPQLVRFEYYVPGETEVYECKNGGCARVFIIPDMDGGKNSRQNIRFPRSFRLKGKPGKFWFRLI